MMRGWDLGRRHTHTHAVWQVCTSPRAPSPQISIPGLRLNANYNFKSGVTLRIMNAFCAIRLFCSSSQRQFRVLIAFLRSLHSHFWCFTFLCVWRLKRYALRNNYTISKLLPWWAWNIKQQIRFKLTIRLHFIKWANMHVLSVLWLICQWHL